MPFLLSSRLSSIYASRNAFQLIADWTRYAKRLGYVIDPIEASL